ncbi:hypothetical protein [uncultured Ramlibacter sp.]|nr:hypothetical protein [uncultured Ramlibacter sp.]
MGTQATFDQGLFAGRQVTGYEDVFTKIEMCRKHYTECGLGAAFVDQYIR